MAGKAGKREIRGVLLDIDGVLYVGGQAVEGGREAVAWLRDNGIPFRCVSNTTSRSRRSIAEKLRGYGYEIDAGLVFNPPLAAVRHLAGKRTFLLTKEGVREDFEAAGIPLAEDDAEAVVVGDAGDGFSYAAMNRAFRMVLDGAAIVALEKDRYWMGDDGLMLSAGPFVAALEYATGQTATVVGKPSAAFFSLALADMGVPPEEALMVGDDIRTDIGGAQGAGMRTALVMTGKFRKDIFDAAPYQPDHLLGSVADLPAVIEATYI
ncbi:MAG: TIGR01458 family HAD-type hydrolase [Methanofollis sp.]|uniref:TIGR01458 family HAD-type hydrolase n=1 Tax=Methanofollis sp. TaxID=2052835 RepID=UPI0026018DA3|nr:TIGR01458 family HAD-type hydrolase [Methanofollis sp.]MDD4255840.1 TIGR01458 family HAD-type hydrolase [Methanofollis sp.]